MNTLRWRHIHQRRIEDTSATQYGGLQARLWLKTTQINDRNGEYRIRESSRKAGSSITDHYMYQYEKSGYIVLVKNNDNNLSRGMRSIFNWDGTNGLNAFDESDFQKCSCLILQLRSGQVYQAAQ